MERPLATRSAGILLHPTSLDGPFESGDLGPSAYAFIDRLAEAGLTYWQVLPLQPAGPGFSPYSATSVFAGSPLLVSLERLRDDGLLDPNDPLLAPSSPTRNADFVAAQSRRLAALRKAFVAHSSSPVHRAKAQRFSEEEAYWLHDFALFSAIKSAHGDKPFTEWPHALRHRNGPALSDFAREHREELLFHEFVQARFASDLQALRRHATSRGVRLMGDAPIYVAHDSADVWAHPRIFQLGDDGEPNLVAAVPPDAFSDEGQVWGNPLYNWDFLASTGFGFFKARLGMMSRAFDAIRLDHFIGFSRYYAVPRGARDAKKGAFHPVPGRALLKAVQDHLQPIALIAEDLGIVTDEVKALRDAFDLPGMSVMLFSFSPGEHAEDSRLHRFAKRSVLYTGTHDNDTAAGWFGSAPENASAASVGAWSGERDFARRYLELPDSATAEDFARELVTWAFRSHVDTVILPMQDILGLGREARMNRPGTAEGNWSFRLLPGERDASRFARVRELAETYGRSR